MKHLVKYLQTVDKRWLITWVLLYLSFVILGAFFPKNLGVTIIKITGILLCVLYAFYKYRNDHLLFVALLLTLIADIVLAIDDVSIVGVIVFCFAQFFHTARLNHEKIGFVLFYVGVAAIVFLAAIWLGVKPMYAAAGIYAYGLLSNLYFSIRWFFSSRSVASSCSAVGFFLFVLCDVCVALSYLGVTAVLPFIFKPIGDYLSWVFYYPSQVLISNSSNLKKARKLKHEK